MSKLYPHIEELVTQLNENVETLLEDSSDEAEERQDIEYGLTELKNVFAAAKFDKAVALIDLALGRVHLLEEFGESENERGVLLLCLLLEEFIATEKLGVDVDDEFFIPLLSELSLAGGSQTIEENINYGLVKILRTHYQKELLAMIRGGQLNEGLQTLQSVVGDLIDELPKGMHNEWQAFEYYLSQYEANPAPKGPKAFFQILALLDQKLAGVLQLKAPKEDFLPQLMDAVRRLPNGYHWLTTNLRSSGTYVSASVYSRFSNSLRDKLLKLHESFERFYLDSSQADEIEANKQLLLDLGQVFHLMGFARLSKLAFTVLDQINRVLANPGDKKGFYATVNSVWSLENSIANLYQLNDVEVPVCVEEISAWSLMNSKREAYRVLATRYHGLAEQVKSGQVDAKALQQQLFLLCYAETHMRPENPLLRATLDVLLKRLFNPKELETLLLALEYIANKNSTSSPIAPAILKDAYQLLGIDGDKPAALKPSVKSAPQSTAQRAPQPAPQSASQAVAPDAPKIEPAPAVKAQPKVQPKVQPVAQPKVQPTVAPKPAVESPRTPVFQPADTVSVEAGAPEIEEITIDFGDDLDESLSKEFDAATASLNNQAEDRKKPSFMRLTAPTADLDLQFMHDDEIEPLTAPPKVEIGEISAPDLSFLDDDALFDAAPDFHTKTQEIGDLMPENDPLKVSDSFLNLSFEDPDAKPKKPAKLTDPPKVDLGEPSAPQLKVNNDRVDGLSLMVEDEEIEGDSGSQKKITSEAELIEKNDKMRKESQRISGSEGVASIVRSQPQPKSKAKVASSAPLKQKERSISSRGKEMADIFGDTVLLEAIADETKELEAEANALLEAESYSKDTISSLSRIAHTLKANIRLINMDRLADRLNEIEHGLITAPKYDAAFVAKVKQEFTDIFSQIKTVLFDTMK
ncbi:hypothetical protein OXI21_00095 [Ignatzschineria sp. RMDPL8A]|uniref:hypothetical protein n=1 Tax=Ignatzschineria sp. RMDPL8A TaxID=2999236 RepID=UPI0024466199|nr:hypothetical protein [Ignatzschineria sp. RMDPL8A]MDG9728830.1 hypothetical protein [Ignatzschineria sp. RMDPL8A]